MGDWKAWKELPYRGEPSDNTPKNKKPKRNRTPNEIRRGNVIGAIIFLSIFGIIFGSFFAAFGFDFDLFWRPALIFIGIFLIPIALSAGIKAWNRYLRGEDLDEPNNSDENR